MAEDSVKTSLALEINCPSGGKPRRNSIGKPSAPTGEQSMRPNFRRASFSSFSDGGNARRNSTGKSSLPDSGENIVPHYLRASSGSCHDFCKYGRAHAFEAKARTPIPKRMTQPLADKQNIGGTSVPAEMKKRTEVKPRRLSHDSMTHSPDPPEIIKREVLFPSKKVEISSKNISSSNMKTKENEKKMVSTAKHAPVKPKYGTAKLSTSSEAPVGLNLRRNSDVIGLNLRRNSDFKLVKRIGTSKTEVKKVLAPISTSFSAKSPVSKVVSISARKNRSLKLVSPLKGQNRIRKVAPVQVSYDEVQEKILHVVKADTENEILEPVQTGSVIQPPPSPLLPSPKSSSRPDSPSLPSPKSSSHLDSSSLSSHEKDLEESEYSDSETISETDEIVNDNIAEFSKGNVLRTRKGGMVLSAENDCSLMKSKFRRGKVLDLHSENNGPRRLKFRRGKVLDDKKDRNGDARRSYKKMEVNDDTKVTSPSSGKVVLRHQGVQGKKDAQGLFNNVIEETASKLVESRKSKVKALVGAFETVISLQESKPSAQTGI